MTERSWRPVPLLGALALAGLLLAWALGAWSGRDGPDPAPGAATGVGPAPGSDLPDAFVSGTPPTTPPPVATGPTRRELLELARALLDPDPGRRLEVLARIRACGNDVVETVLYDVSAARRSSSELTGIADAMADDPELAMPVLLHRISFSAPRTRRFVVQALTPVLAESPEAAAFVFIRAIADPDPGVRRAAFHALLEASPPLRELVRTVFVPEEPPGTAPVPPDLLLPLLEAGTTWFAEDPRREIALTLVLAAEQQIMPPSTDDVIGLVALDLRLLHIALSSGTFAQRRDGVREILRSQMARRLFRLTEPKPDGVWGIDMARRPMLLERIERSLLLAMGVADVPGASAGLGNASTQRLALIALARMGSKARPALPAILRLVEAPAWPRELVAALRVIDPTAPESTEALRRLVRREDLGRDARVEAALAQLGALGGGWEVVQGWTQLDEGPLPLDGLRLGALCTPDERPLVAPWYRTNLEAYLHQGRERLRRAQRKRMRRLLAAHGGDAEKRARVLLRLQGAPATDAKAAWRAARAWADGD